MVRDVSAIVVSYHTGPVLGAALRALRTQAGLSEIVLVDNGNPPGVVDAAIADSETENDGQRAAPVRVLTGHGNVGFAMACNKGVEAATGDYLLFVNPDALLPEGGLAALKAHADGLARPFLVAPLLADPDGAEQQGSRRAKLTPWRAIIEATKLYRLAPSLQRFNQHEDPVPQKLTQVEVISGACFFMPKADYSKIGGMDEAYFLHVEDVDFCVRFAEAGGAIWFDPHIAVMHHKSSSEVSAAKVEAWKTTSLNRYFRTHFANKVPPGGLLLLGAGLWAAFAVRMSVRFARSLFQRAGAK